MDFKYLSHEQLPLAYNTLLVGFALATNLLPGQVTGKTTVSLRSLWSVGEFILQIPKISGLLHINSEQSF